MEKPLKVAVWSGVILLISMLFVRVLLIAIKLIPRESFIWIKSILIFTFHLPVIVFIFLFMQGFVALGKRFNNSFLKIMSWIGIFIFILLTIFNAFLAVYGYGYQFYYAFGYSFLGSVVAIYSPVIIISLYLILFGASLISFREIKLTKISGILSIIVAVMYIIGSIFLFSIIPKTLTGGAESAGLFFLFMSEIFYGIMAMPSLIVYILLLLILFRSSEQFET